MATDSEGKPECKDVAPMSDYGMRAAMALDQVVPGPHRDKTIARKLNISLRMAKYLRAGQHWSIARMNQASAALGTAFDAALYSPGTSAEFHAETAEFEARLARLEARFEEVVRGGDAGLAPHATASAALQSREDCPERGTGLLRSGGVVEDASVEPQRPGSRVAGTVRESRRGVADRDHDGSAR